MGEVVQYLTDRGVVMVESSNDFDSTDHQGGMYWPGVVPGNSVEVDPAGTGWTRSDTTSWGTHNMFDVANAGSTSTSTADLGGLFGLLMSSGDEQLGHGQPTAAFSGPEAVQVMRETASPVQNTAQAWPGAPGDWSEQYGYGIVNLDRAMQAIGAGALPPVATIASPDWYSLDDPTTTTSVAVTATVQAPAGTAYHWTLQYGLGPQPGRWHTVDSGAGTASGRPDPIAGTLELAQIPRSFWEATFTVTQNQTLPDADQYDVTLRLVATDATGTTGMDRRTIDVVHDPSWAPGFPLALHASGLGAPALADLTGDRQARHDLRHR